MTHFLLLTHGTRGDVDPFIAIGGSLRRRGHRVTVFTHEPYRAAADAVGVSFRAVDEEATYAAHLRRAAEVIRPRSGAAMREFYRDRELFLDRIGLAGGLRQLRREISLLVGCGDDAVVVGRHTFCLAGMIMAEMTGSQLCLVAPAPGYIMIAAAVALHLAQSIGAELNEIRRENGLSEIANWSHWIGRCDLRIGLWPRWFDEAGQRAPAGTALVGFPLADRSAHLASRDPLIDAPEDVVVVTGGSGRMLHPGFHRAAVDGLVKAGRRGIVVTPHPDLIGPLPDGIIHRLALPFDDVMPTVAGVVHHGGIGTVARALRSGVPQLVLADSADRPDNGARLESLGLARSLGPENWDADTIAAEIQEFGSASRRQVAARSVGLTTGPEAVETAVDQICSLA